MNKLNRLIRLYKINLRFNRLDRQILEVEREQNLFRTVTLPRAIERARPAL